MGASPRIVVVDYHKGNLSSVVRGLSRVGAQAVATDDPDKIRQADGIVLPGVGSFFDAISFMRASGQDAAITEAIAGGTGTPFLGICLGQQLLYDCGDEGVPAEAPLAAVAAPRGGGLAPGTVFAEGGTRWVRGLGVLKGSCTLLPARRLKIPHVGWDQVHLTEQGRSCPLLAGFDEGANVYFTHSYAVAEDADAQDVAAHTFYACAIPSVIWHGNIFGCQFHPEKSSAHGAGILRNFTSICQGAIA